MVRHLIIAADIVVCLGRWDLDAQDLFTYALHDSGKLQPLRGIHVVRQFLKLFVIEFVILCGTFDINIVCVTQGMLDSVF